MDLDRDRSWSRSVNEIIFVVENAPEGGYSARALGESIFTEADDLEELHRNVREAVLCHFGEVAAPKAVRFRLTRERPLGM